VYKQIQERYGERPTEESITEFISYYLQEHKIAPDSYTQQYQREWEEISKDFHTRAQTVFNTTLPESITVYLTINNRCPYSIQGNFFYVSFPRESVRKTIMHELWHFYTWYGLGTDQEVELGKEKYNELKEALTVLLNVECGGLLPDGVIDEGYPQHQALRQQIVELWEVHKDINKVWKLIQ
jgi:hypothetical protein